MNVRFIFIKLLETWQANKLQSEPSKDNKLAEPSWGSWVLWDFFTGLSMISWSHATLYVLFLIFLVFFIYIIPVMKLLDWLSWSKGTSRSASDRVSKVYRFQTSRLIRGCPGWPGCCLVTVTLVSLLWSCHTSSIHTSARPLSQLGTCAGTLLPAATKQPACFSLWRRARKPLRCRIVAHTLHDVNIWPAPQLSLFLTNPKYWRLVLITVDTIMILESNVKCLQSCGVQLIRIFIHSNIFFHSVPACVCVCVCLRVRMCVCVCVISRLVYMMLISCHNTLSDPSHCDIEHQLITDKDN